MEASVVLERSGAKDAYPVALEDTLTEAILRRDPDIAKSTLNRILTHVFFDRSTAEEDGLIAVRLAELFTVISRAAIKAGADTARTLSLNADCLREAARRFAQTSDIEEVAAWSGSVLEKYTVLLNSLTDTRHAAILSDVKNYMLANYMRPLTLGETAEHVFLSPTYLSRLFRAEVGLSFNQYLNKIRIEQSKYLLLFTSKPLSEIYSLTGFEDQSYFTKVFKHIVGVSPGKYRAAAGKSENRKI